MFKSLDIKKIENFNIFKNINDPNFNSCVIIYRDHNNKPYLAYFEKIYQNIDFEIKSDEIVVGEVIRWDLNKTFSITNTILPSEDKSFIKIIDLSYEPETKEMTKEQIEKELGYKVKII